jgi:hypothetical protein
MTGNNKNAPKTEEKKDEPTSIQISRAFKATLDELPGKSYEDKLRGLMARSPPPEADADDDRVTLKMTEATFRQLIAWQPSVLMSDMLQKSRV